MTEDPAIGDQISRILHLQASGMHNVFLYKFNLIFTKFNEISNQFSEHTKKLADWKNGFFEVNISNLFFLNQ